MMKTWLLAGLAAIAFISGAAQAQPIGERRFVMAMRLEDAGSVGFIDLASVRTTGDYKEADALLVLRAPTQPRPAGRGTAARPSASSPPP